jgi:hypothetical protein
MNLTPYPAEGADSVRPGYEQFFPPAAPAGMYADPETGLVLPLGVCPRERGRVTAAYALAVLLFVVTLGVGYLAWAVVTWGGGQTPAQKLLGLRCWQPQDGRLAGRSSMAIRQVTGLLLNGEFLMGPISLLATGHMTSVGDFFAGTVVLHDPDDILPGWTAPEA